MSAPDARACAGSGASSIEAALATTVLGRPLCVYEQLSSTNDMAKEFAIKGAPEGLAVLAHAQTNGRGRQGRNWESMPGKGVYLSVVLRPEISPADAGSLSILGGVAILEALEHLRIGGLSLKWPNDVLARGRKIAGVLVEPRVGTSRVDFAILGIGVNVGQTPAAWSGTLKRTATSCHMEGSAASVDEVVVAVLNELDRRYAQMKEQGAQEVLRIWQERGGTKELPVID